MSPEPNACGGAIITKVRISCLWLVLQGAQTSRSLWYPQHTASAIKKLETAKRPIVKNRQRNLNLDTLDILKGQRIQGKRPSLN